MFRLAILKSFKKYLDKILLVWKITHAFKTLEFVLDILFKIWRIIPDKSSTILKITIAFKIFQLTVISRLIPDITAKIFNKIIDANLEI